MRSLHEAIESIALFQARRQAENYAPGGKGLDRVAVMEGIIGSRIGTENQAPAQSVDWSLKAGVTDHGDGRGWVADDTWECRVGAIVFKQPTPEAAVGAAIEHFRDLAWPAIVAAAEAVEKSAQARGKAVSRHLSAVKEDDSVD